MAVDSPIDGGKIEQLTGVVGELAAEVRTLRIAIDELRDDVAHALRDGDPDCLTLHRRLRRMSLDSASPDFKINAMSEAEITRARDEFVQGNTADHQQFVRDNINTILTGDCVSGMQSLPTRSVDLVFADPPFNIGYEYDEYDDQRAASEYIDWCRQWIAEAVRTLKPAGTFWVAIGDEYAAELKCLLQQHDLTLRNWVIWYYTFGMNCRMKFSRSHTHLLYMVKDNHNFTLNDSEIRVPSARQLDGDDRAHPDGRIPDDTWILRPQDIPDSFQPDEDTWHVPRVNGTFGERQRWHPCQMPEQLLGRIIRACSNPGDLVLDSFVGSGTTPAVAKKLGRRFIGFELSDDYAARARERVQSASDGQALEGSEQPLIRGHGRRASRPDSRQQNLW